MYDLIVIGAGPGGYEAALHAGRMGKKVLLVEKQHIGGTCLNVGCIPTKTLLHSAKIYEQALDAAPFGVKVGEVSFDMAAVNERKNAVVKKLTAGVESMLKAAKVDVVSGHGRLAGIGRVEVDGSVHEAAHVLLATGSRPARPPIPGIDGPRVTDSTGILETTRVPESIVIVGGGVIGIEFASFFASVGSKVTVVEMLERICPALDADVATALARELKKRGVDIHTSARVERIDDREVRFARKGESAAATGEVVLVATGRQPVLDGLGLEDAHVESSARGIAVDAQGRTNVARLWGCGDVTGRCLLAHSAVREGQVAVNSMFGAQDAMRYDAMPWVVYSHPEVAGVGLTEAQARERGIAHRTVKKPLAVAGRYQVEHGSAPGLVKAVIGSERGEVLGVHMIGGGCSEMIWGAAALIENEMRTADAAEIIFPHPTISEAIKEAVMH
jgi:dihydrolipoamide dehydrogenase